MEESKIKGLIRVIYETIRAQWLRVRYGLVMRNLRKIYGSRKIRVGFMVCVISKWKGQSLYDLMETTEDIEPVLLLLPSLEERDGPTGQIEKAIADKENFFKKKGMRVKSIWDVTRNNCMKAREIDVDIIFYQDPWIIDLHLGNASGRSLTFYYPYYVPNAFNPEYGVKMHLHKTVFRHIFHSDNQVQLYKPFVHQYRYAGEMVGLGHPGLDVFYLRRNEQAKNNYVIYAPHFSFKCDRDSGPLPYYSSTFLENGRLMLGYAKAHPEINWAFKPHPRLRTELSTYGIWSKEEVNRYYAEWEEIGITCYDSDYIDLFFESKAMITDCSSFLTEYGCTGKPLIRPIPEQGKTLSLPNPAVAKLYDSYYNAYDNNDLLKLLDMILIEGQDPKKEERIIQLQNAKLTGTYAAKNIIEYIRELLS
jgi:hypothetical protein